MSGIRSLLSSSVSYWMSSTSSATSTLRALGNQTIIFLIQLSETQNPIPFSEEWGRSISARSSKVVLVILPEALSKVKNGVNLHLFGNEINKFWSGSKFRVPRSVLKSLRGDPWSQPQRVSGSEFKVQRLRKNNSSQEVTGSIDKPGVPGPES